MAEDPRTAQELNAVAQLRAALRRFNAVSDEVTGRHGLTPRRYDLLAMLHAKPPSETATQLGRQLQLTLNATSELISRAEEAGLVKRTQSPADARVKAIVPTKEGSARYLRAVSELAAARQRLLAILADLI
jgi:DNA-binding MarR family transcriptional regulator